MIKKAIISGGGTGGHIFPAISIAQELQKQVPGIDILFVGAKGKMEMEKVPRSGFPIEGLWISGLQRKITIDNLAFPFKVLSSLYHSHKILSRFQPDIAVGVGGFASGPLLFAATMKKIPTLIHEQNSYAGITNKILSKSVDKICVAYDGMERFFPAHKLIKTGNPVRKDILDISNKKELGIQKFGLNNALKTIMIIGGSLGARTINQTITAQIARIKERNDIQLLWQTGGYYYSELEEYHGGNVHVYDFIYEMDLAYACADIVISRAGASSISELALVEKPVILVPSPNVAEDHQTKNALALTEHDAAILVKDQQAMEELIPLALALANDKARQENLIKQIKNFAIPDAADRIVKEILKLT